MRLIGDRDRGYNGIAALATLAATAAALIGTVAFYPFSFSISALTTACSASTVTTSITACHLRRRHLLTASPPPSLSLVRWFMAVLSEFNLIDGYKGITFVQRKIVQCECMPHREAYPVAQFPLPPWAFKTTAEGKGAAFRILPAEQWRASGVRVLKLCLNNTRRGPRRWVAGRRSSSINSARATGAMAAAVMVKKRRYFGLSVHQRPSVAISLIIIGHHHSRTSAPLRQC